MTDGQLVLDCIANAPAPHNKTKESILAAAAADAEPHRVVKHMVAILRSLEYEGGMNDEQLETSTRIPANSLRPRRRALDLAGLIRRCGDSYTRSGHRAAAWFLTDEGSRVVRDLRSWRYFNEA